MNMLDKIKLSHSSQLVKYLLFIFNLLFVISGIVLISVGSAIYWIYKDYEQFLDGKYFSVPNLLIATGSIVLIISFFGCCGALRENYCMLVTFTALMVLVFILEFSAGISGYVLRGSASELLQSKMLKTMETYKANNEYYTIWDRVQASFTCCGTKNPDEWPPMLAEQMNNSTLKDLGYLPVSCCPPKGGSVGEFTCSLSEKHYDKGCLDAIAEFIKSHAAQLGGVGLAICFMQGLGIWFSVHLSRAVKRSYNNM